MGNNAVVSGVRNTSGASVIDSIITCVLLFYPIFSVVKPIPLPRLIVMKKRVEYAIQRRFPQWTMMLIRLAELEHDKLNKVFFSNQ